MALKINPDECLGCGACESTCPPGAISQASGFQVLYEIDPLRCNDCDRCRAVCPVEGFLVDAEWAVCHGRGCPLSSKRYDGWECSEGTSRCPECASMMWRAPGAEWACQVCADRVSGERHASCPKLRHATVIART